MSITFTKAYVANGKTFATLREAQVASIETLFPHFANANEISESIVEQSDWVVDVLTMKETSRPKARGSKKPRKNRVTEPVQTTSA